VPLATDDHVVCNRHVLVWLSAIVLHENPLEGRSSALLQEIIADDDVLDDCGRAIGPKLDRVGMLASVGGEIHKGVVGDQEVRRLDVVDAVAV
jgi:hypothetical protein